MDREQESRFGDRHDSQDRQDNGDATADEPRAPVTYIPADQKGRSALKKEHNLAGINFKKYLEIPVEQSGENKIAAMTSFADSGLHRDILYVAADMQYLTPTPIQQFSIPAILAKRDVMACAQTGSGKTAGYLFPIISNLLNEGVNEGVESAAALGKAQPQVLIVCPTRELAAQVDNEANAYVEGTGLKTFAVYGQTETRHMANRLRCGVNIISATTGRLNWCLERDLITLENLQYLVLDEADRMLDMGFSADIDKIARNRTMPRERVTLMFSATFAPDIQALAQRFLKNYLFITTGIVGGACGDVTQEVIKVEGRADKKEMLEELLRQRAVQQEDGKLLFEKTLVFCETKEETDKIGLELAVNGISSTTIHGNRTQEQREMALADFKSGRKAVLVATNVAARGLDIPDVKHVINWDLPKSSDDMTEYVHRIGRTGRVGNQGLATTFYCPSRNSAVARELVKIMENSGNNVPDFLYEDAGMSVSSGDRHRTAPSSEDNHHFGGRDTRGFGFGARDDGRACDPSPILPSKSYGFGQRGMETKEKQEEDDRYSARRNFGTRGNDGGGFGARQNFGGGDDESSKPANGNVPRFGQRIGGGDCDSSEAQAPVAASRFSKFGRRTEN